MRVDFSYQRLQNMQKGCIFQIAEDKNVVLIFKDWEID